LSRSQSRFSAERQIAEEGIIVAVAIITGAAGLVGSEAVRYFSSLGLDVLGIDNGMRAMFFGPDASTDWVRRELEKEIKGYRHFDADIRDQDTIFGIFREFGSDVQLIIHAAAQPSHDWAASQPFTDFAVNAQGTLVLLEATRQFAPESVFIFTSTNKVYGDLPNQLPLVELKERWEIDANHPYKDGIPEELSIDRSMHSLFGASKVSADIFVQEYGRYFGMKTVCFRGGCLTGPNHSGTQLHGFLAYLMRCAVTDRPYTVFGYKGKQVRDNIHSKDLIHAFHEFFKSPRVAEVYNVGGGRFSNCSMLEAIALCQEITGREMDWNYRDEIRKGDHQWWISDLTRFRSHYPAWQLTYDVPRILREIHGLNLERWSAR
jgi:CDP-paratose 2-epimerase